MQLLLVFLPLSEQHPQGRVDLLKVLGLGLQIDLPAQQRLLRLLALLHFPGQAQVGRFELGGALAHQVLQLVLVSAQGQLRPFEIGDIPQGDDIAHGLARLVRVEAGTELHIKLAAVPGHSPGFKEADLFALEHGLDGLPGIGPGFRRHEIDLFAQQLLACHAEGLLEGGVDVGGHPPHVVHHDGIGR